MMCDRFEEWEGSITEYCAQNGLSFEKAKHMVKASNKDSLVLLYYGPELESGDGLLDETPLPDVLWVKREADGLRFEQTEHTQKYLAQ
ncbi:MAG: hypothetical protein LUC30_10275 [Clostridiales bacterium]|nr:hypothetical protein [Clostridiales bacterium]